MGKIFVVPNDWPLTSVERLGFPFGVKVIRAPVDGIFEIDQEKMEEALGLDDPLKITVPRDIFSIAAEEAKLAQEKARIERARQELAKKHPRFQRLEIKGERDKGG
jgi:hypothetical protein